MYEIILSLIVFGLGTALASFYIAQIYRIENELPFPQFVTQGSFCEKCKKELVWYELIPILGYLLQGGKCSKCGYKVPHSYPIFELVNGLTLLILFINFASLEYYFFSQVLFFLAAYDFYHKGFPKQLMHTFLIMSVLWGLYRYFYLSNFDMVVFAAAAFLVVVIILMNLLKRSFGVGDLLIVLMMGFVLNLNEFLSWIFLSIVIAGLFALILVILKKADRKDTIPFVPFMHIAFMMLFLFQPQIDRYLTYFMYLW